MQATNNLFHLFDLGTGLVNLIIPLIVTLAAAMFVWGVVNFFIISSGDEAKRTQGKQFIIWGIIAFVVISSVWGIVKILGNTAGLSGYTRVLPKSQYPGYIPPTTTRTGGSTTRTSGTKRGGLPTTGSSNTTQQECIGKIDGDSCVFEGQDGQCQGGVCLTPGN